MVAGTGSPVAGYAARLADGREQWLGAGTGTAPASQGAGAEDQPGNSSSCEGSPGLRSSGSSGTAPARHGEGRGEPPCSGGEGSRAPAAQPVHRPGQKSVSSLGRAEFGNSILQASSPSLRLLLVCSLISGSRQKPLQPSRRQSGANFQQAPCFPPRRRLAPILPPCRHRLRDNSQGHSPSTGTSPSPRVTLHRFSAEQPFGAVTAARPCTSCSKKGSWQGPPGHPGPDSATPLPPWVPFLPGTYGGDSGGGVWWSLVHPGGRLAPYGV